MKSLCLEIYMQIFEGHIKKRVELSSTSLSALWCLAIGHDSPSSSTHSPWMCIFVLLWLPGLCWWLLIVIIRCFINTSSSQTPEWKESPILTEFLNIVIIVKASTNYSSLWLWSQANCLYFLNDFLSWQLPPAFWKSFCFIHFIT